VLNERFLRNVKIGDSRGSEPIQSRGALMKRAK
jgi:hypothetical protein